MLGIFLQLSLLLVACDVQNPLATPTSKPELSTSTIAPTPTMPPSAESVGGFQLFLTQVNELKPDQRQAQVNRYMAQVTVAPIVGENSAIFLWQGAAETVAVTGDMNNWDPSRQLPLTRLEGSDLWYLQQDYDADARLDYKFVVNGNSLQLDPLNPEIGPSEIGPRSVLKMPGYQSHAELLEEAGVERRGSLTTFTLQSANLNQLRTFIVYEPAGQIVGEKLPSLYVNDGGNYLNLISSPAILNNLIARREIPPMIVVFLPPVLTNEDYNQNDAYVSFLADELVPFIQTRFRSDPRPGLTGIVGSALGGGAALHAAITRPDVFGLAAGQSPVFLDGGDGLLLPKGRDQVAQDDSRPQRLYLVVGSYESAVSVNGDVRNLTENNRLLANGLVAAGYQIKYEQVHEGHSWGSWQGTLDQALITLFGNSFP